MSVNPPVKLVWKGKTIEVRRASEALAAFFLTPEEEQELLKELHRVSPGLVKGGPGGRMSFATIVRYLKALWKRWGNNLKLVDPALADQRAEICLKCDQIQDVSGCGPCSGIAGLMMGVQRNGIVKDRGCQLCGCFLEVKVQLEAEMDERDVDFPDNCWVKQEAQMKPASRKDM